MPDTIAARLDALGPVLPPVTVPRGSFKPFTIAASMLHPGLYLLAKAVVELA